MSADVGGLRMLARELGEHEQFQVHAHVLNNAATEIWVMQKKLEQYQQMAEKAMQVIALEREENARLREELSKWESLTAGIDLPEYPVTQFKPKDLERENAKLQEQVERLQPKDCEGNVLDIADTVNMLRSEYDGDHEWDDVVVELALTKWGGDRWIVRGSKGEAWACDCTKTGHDDAAFEASDDAVPLDDPTLIEAENAKLRKLVRELWTYAEQELLCDENCPYGAVCDWRDCVFERRMRETGIEVDE